MPLALRPGDYDYRFDGDEAFHVLEGAATVDLPDTEEKVELRAGDVADFSAGTRSIWTITQPFKNFTVIANLGWLAEAVRCIAPERCDPPRMHRGAGCRKVRPRALAVPTANIVPTLAPPGQFKTAGERLA